MSTVRCRSRPRGAVLYQEAELLVREELRGPRVHYSILRAVSDGMTRSVTQQLASAEPLAAVTGLLTSLLFKTWNRPSTCGQLLVHRYDTGSGRFQTYTCASGSGLCCPTATDSSMAP